MNWNNVSLIVLGLTAFFSAFVVALWISLVIWTFRDMRARARDAFAQLLAALMVLVLGPLGVILYFILRPRETLAEKYERSLEEEALLQDIEERQICPGCKQPIEPDYVICPVCHTRLRRPCIHCGRLVHPRWGVCPYCAESQRPIPGVERAGRVTLLDLETELESPEAELMEPQEEIESVAALEEEAMRNLDRARYGMPLEPEWEQAEMESEGSGPEVSGPEVPGIKVSGTEEAESRSESFSLSRSAPSEVLSGASSDASEDMSEDELDSEQSAVETEQTETEAVTDKAPRRTFLFRRG